MTLGVVAVVAAVMAIVAIAGLAIVLREGFFRVVATNEGWQ